MSGDTANVSSPPRRKVLFMGLFPPPIDGQRVITQRVFERLDAISMVTRYDVSRFGHLGAFSKLVSAIAACFVVPGARLRGYSTLYLAPHSGSGLLYSCLIALVSRCFGYSLAVHYHSYRNFGRYSWLMATFLAICGPNTMHIVLAPPMAYDLQRLYGPIRRIAVVSNSGFVTPRRVVREFGGVRLRVGHLSNLSREKGIAIVLECMRAARGRGINVELWLAGPAENTDTGRLISAAQVEFGEQLKYLGRLDAAGVYRFYENIDVFLFPTSHKHEAEPLVIIDAVSAGVPVIATDRGCIGYLLGSAGTCVLPVPNFVEGAVEQIASWADDPDTLAEASHRAHARFIEVHRESQMDLERLLATILNEERGQCDQPSSKRAVL